MAYAAKPTSTGRVVTLRAVSRTACVDVRVGMAHKDPLGICHGTIEDLLSTTVKKRTRHVYTCGARYAISAMAVESIWIVSSTLRQAAAGVVGARADR